MKLADGSTAQQAARRLVLAGIESAGYNVAEKLGFELSGVQALEVQRFVLIELARLTKQWGDLNPIDFRLTDDEPKPD